MPVVTGTLEDIGANSMASLNARIILSSQEVATKGSVIMPTQEIVAEVGSGGAFSFPNVRASLENNPYTPYKLAIEWQDSAGNYTRTDFPSFQIVVPSAGGRLADMVALVTPNKIVTKGDSATTEDIQAAVSAVLPGELASNSLVVAAGAQAATAALAAKDILVGGQQRSPANGEDDKFQVAFEDGAMPFQATKEGVFLGDTLVEASEQQGFVDEDGRFLLQFDTSTGETIIYKPVFPNGGGGVGGSTVPVTTLHVFLAVGQSNMSGRGLPSGGSYDPVDPRLFQYGATNRTFRAATVPLDMHDPASGLSPATAFARNYLTMQPANVGVLIIPAAHGGTGFTGSTSELTWSVGVATNPALDLPELAVAQTLEGIAAAKAAGYTVELKGALWHQGENNSSLSTSGYAAKLDELIAFFRTRLSSPKLPFVAGQMTPETIASVPGRDGIDRAHYETPARVAYTGFARATANGVNVGETVHFSRAGVEYLGKTYLSGFWQAVGNVLAAAPGDPVGLAATKSGTTVTAIWDAPPENLTRDVAYSLYGGGETYTWAGAQSHITGYKVEVKTGAGAWAEVSRYSTMRLYETITGVPAGTTQVRVTALNGAAASTTKTVTATGA